MGSPYVNDGRTKEQRRARYCFLSNCCGLPRPVVRAIVGRSDSNIVKSLKYIERVENQ